MDNNQRLGMIDAQHHELFDIFMAVQARKENADRQYMEEVFRRLDEYLYNHFTFEERFMASIGFQDLEKHAELHNGIRSYIANKKAQFMKCGREEEMKDIVSRLAVYLNMWLKEHIMSVDMQYRAFMSSRH